MENKKTKLAEISISSTSTILDALKLMDTAYKKLLVVFTNYSFLSLLSIGDIQRAIISGIPVEESISKILRDNIRLAKETDSFDDIQALMLEWRAECMPVVNDENKLVDIYFWEEVFGEKEQRKKVNSISQLLLWQVAKEPD